MINLLIFIVSILKKKIIKFYNNYFISYVDKIYD